MHRDSSALSFADAMVGEKGRNASLERISQVVDWTRIAAVVGDVHAAPEGRPSYPPLAMVKALCWVTGTSCPMRAWNRRCRTGCRSCGFAGLA